MTRGSAGRPRRRRYLLLVNPGAGAAGDRDVVAEAKRRLKDVETVEVAAGLPLASVVSAALDQERVVVAVGGDGTANAAVQHVVGRGTLGVLPTGTLNHFSRDLGIEDADAALRVLEAGHRRRIDIGRAGSRFFLNNAGMGWYPELIRERERIEGMVGKWPAAVAMALKVLAGTTPLVGTISADGDHRSLSAWVLFVGNNRFGSTPGNFATRERLDEAVLDLRLLRVGSRAARAAAAYGVLTRGPWELGRVVRTEARRVEVELDGSPRLVSTDGEARTRARTLRVEILPRALDVLGPPV